MQDLKSLSDEELIDLYEKTIGETPSPRARKNYLIKKITEHGEEKTETEETKVSEKVAVKQPEWEEPKDIFVHEGDEYSYTQQAGRQTLYAVILKGNVRYFTELQLTLIKRSPKTYGEFIIPEGSPFFVSEKKNA